MRKAGKCCFNGFIVAEKTNQTTYDFTQINNKFIILQRKGAKTSARPRLLRPRPSVFFDLSFLGLLAWIGFPMSLWHRLWDDEQCKVLDIKFHAFQILPFF